MVVRWRGCEVVKRGVRLVYRPGPILTTSPPHHQLFAEPIRRHPDHLTGGDRLPEDRRPQAAALPAANDAARADPRAADWSVNLGRASGASRSGFVRSAVAGPAPEALYGRGRPLPSAAPTAYTDRASPGTATPPSADAKSAS